MCLIFLGAFAHAAGAAGAVGGATVGTLGAANGGHAASVGAGVGHTSALATGRSSVDSATRAGLTSRSSNGLYPITATYSGPPRYLPGGFAPNVISHAPSVNPAAQRAWVASTAQSQNVVSRSVPAARVRNRWTDPSTSGDVRNTGSGTVYDPPYQSDVLGDRFGSGNSGFAYNGSRFNQFRQRGYQYGYGYGYPFPYLFSGGYAPYFDGDPSAYTAPANNSVGEDVNGEVAATDSPSPAAANDLSRPYPTNSYLVTTPGDSTPAAASQGPAGQNVQSNSGPDSLVEAVQAELARRGYFGGKVDAIYNDATHAAIQRFQTDQHLPASGRLNEATLHALELD